MLNIIRLNEFFLDRWDGKYNIVKTTKTHSVGENPHYIERYTQRVKSLPYKTLTLPASTDELTELVLSKCESNYLRGVSEFDDTKSLVGYYTQIHPLSIQDENGKIVFTVWLELTVMYKVSGVQFNDQDALKLLNNLRKANADIEERNQVLRDNCAKGWLPYIEEGTISDDKLAVFIESVAVSLSEPGTYPATWTHARNDLGREEVKFKELIVKINPFKQIVRGIAQNADCSTRIQSDVIKGFCKYHGIKLPQK